MLSYFVNLIFFKYQLVLTCRVTCRCSGPCTICLTRDVGGARQCVASCASYGCSRLVRGRETTRSSKVRCRISTILKRKYTANIVCFDIVSIPIAFRLISENSLNCTNNKRPVTECKYRCIGYGPVNRRICIHGVLESRSYKTSSSFRGL